MNANIAPKDIWDTRPVRLPRAQGGQKSLVAGVCEGIGVRYRIDPTVVRIAFVTAFFFGSGLTLYLLCWLLMPRYTVAKAPIEALVEPAGSPYKSEQRTGYLLIIALLLLTSAFTVGPAGLFGGTTSATILLAALAIYGLHSRTPEPPQGLLVNSTNQGPRTNLSQYVAAEGFTAPATPPAWDPLGAAPQLWHLPEPQAPTPPKKNRTAWLWLAIGGVVTVIAMPLGLLTIGIATYDGGALGNDDVTITNENELSDTYTVEAGNLHLDLSQLPAISKDTTVTITADMGNATVVLPPTIPSVTSCTATLGDARCESYTDGTGPTLFIKGEATMGNLTVTR